MNLEIKPGTLCYIRGAQGLDAVNNGHVVEAIERVQALPEMRGAAAWKATSRGLITARTSQWDLQTIQIQPGTVMYVREDILVPLAGPGLEDEVRQADAQPLTRQQEKQRVFAALYGASIERVRSL